MGLQRGTTPAGMRVAITAAATTLAVAAGGLEAQSAPVALASSPEAVTASSAEASCSRLSDLQDQQPVLLYASAFRFSYESSCGSRDDDERLGGYQDSDTPSSDAPMTIAAGGPMVWPNGAFADLGADTVSYFFQADRTTPRTDDFVLMRQVGGRRPEPVVRNVLAYPGRPFFQYYYRKHNPDNSRPVTTPVPTSWLPLQHAAPKHGSVADSGVVARIDTLRAVEVNYSVTNGRTGADERVELVSFPVAIASLGLKKRTRPCEEPLFSQAGFAPRPTDESCSEPAW